MLRTVMPLTSNTLQPPVAASAAKSGRRGRLLLIIVWLLSAGYAGLLLDRGWVPHDEGTIGQSVERVLDGELPHRDFGEVYTGGLTYLNAFAFRTLGENLISPRIVLFVFFLAWIPAVYAIASRFASPASAALVTMLAMSWSIPNYSAALPSWYNLFFATFGTAALLRYIESDAPRWLWAAGLCGGLSLLFKVSGLYYIAAVLLFLLFREQGMPEAGAPAKGGRIYSWFGITGLVMFACAVFLMVRHNLSAVAAIEYLLPPVLVAALCAWRELRTARGAAGKRFRTLFQMLAPFVLGVTIPVALFLIPYLRAGAVHDLYDGVFVLPMRRFVFAALRPAGFGLNKDLTTAALTALLLVAYLSPVRRWAVKAAIGAALAAVLILAAYKPAVLALVWAPLTLLVPLVVVAGVVILARVSGISWLRQQQVMLVLTVTACCTLIQFPFPGVIYFCYVAPLLALALLALAATGKSSSVTLGRLLALFYLAFAVFLITPGFIYVMGLQYQPNAQKAVLQLPRADGLRVHPREAEAYEQLISLVREHAGNSGYIYAAPDCPEVYFLAGQRNPTRTIFDFLGEPAGRTQRVLDAIETHKVKTVVILTRPAFSPPMAPDLVAALRQQFPHSGKVAYFEVRWKD